MPCIDHPAHSVAASRLSIIVCPPPALVRSCGTFKRTRSLPMGLGVKRFATARIWTASRLPPRARRDPGQHVPSGLCPTVLDRCHGAVWAGTPGLPPKQRGKDLAHMAGCRRPEQAVAQCEAAARGATAIARAMPRCALRSASASRRVRATYPEKSSARRNRPTSSSSLNGLRRCGDRDAMSVEAHRAARIRSA